MKNLDVVFKHGRFYNTKTGKRLIFREDTECALQCDNDALLDKDEINERPLFFKNEKQKLAEVEGAKKVKSFVKLLPAGTILWFRNGHKTRENSKGEKGSHVFQVRLLEDFYIYKGAKKEPVAFDCACEVFSSSPKLDFFEPIYGKSLSNAFERASTFYFTNLRSPAANIFKEYYLGDSSFHKPKSLGDLRREAKDKLGKSS